MTFFAHKAFKKALSLSLLLTAAVFSETIAYGDTEAHLKALLSHLESIESESTLPGIGILGSLSQFLRELHDYLDEVPDLTSFEKSQAFVARMNPILNRDRHKKILGPEFLQRWNSSYQILSSSQNLSEWQTEIKNLLTLITTQPTGGILLEEPAFKDLVLHSLGYNEVHRTASVSRAWLDHLSHFESRHRFRDEEKKEHYLSPAPEEKGSEGDYLMALQALDLANTHSLWRYSCSHLFALNSNDNIRHHRLAQFFTRIDTLRFRCKAGSLPEQFLRLTLIPHIHCNPIDLAIVSDLERLSQNHYPFAKLILKNWQRVLDPDEILNQEKEDLPFPPSFRPERQMRNFQDYQNTPDEEIGPEKEAALLSSLVETEFLNTTKFDDLNPNHPIFYGDLERATSYYLRRLISSPQNEDSFEEDFSILSHLVTALLKQNRLPEAIDQLEHFRRKNKLFQHNHGVYELLLECYCRLSISKEPLSYYEWAKPKMEDFMKSYQELPASYKEFITYRIKVSALAGYDDTEPTQSFQKLPESHSKGIIHRVPVSSLLLHEDVDRASSHNMIRALGLKELGKYDEALDLASASDTDRYLLQLLELSAKAKRLDRAAVWIEKLKEKHLHSFTDLFPVIEAFHEANALPLIYEAIKPQLSSKCKNFSNHAFPKVLPLIELAELQEDHEFAFDLLRKFSPDSMTYLEQCKYHYLYNKVAPLVPTQPFVIRNEGLEPALAKAKTDAMEAIAILVEDEKPAYAEQVRSRIAELYQYIGRDVPEEFEVKPEQDKPASEAHLMSQLKSP